jgi:CheY-like chemotaxis protein
MAALGRHVLVLEDEWIIADQIEAALEGAGYAVVGPVGRADAAMALAQSRPLDAAVLDINVHGDRSFRVARQLAQDGIPFIFLSGYPRAELPAALRERPLIQKPIDLPALCRCMESLLPTSA